MSKLDVIDHHSVSSIVLARNCPRAWWAKYVLKQQQTSSEAASFGNQYDSEISKRLGVEIHPKPYADEAEKLPLLDGVEEAVTGYLCQPHALKSATDAQVKIDISPEKWRVLAEMYGLSAEIKKPVTGYIDLWSKAERILIDLKTSKRKNARWEWVMQILIYALAKNASESGIHLMTRTKVPQWYEIKVPVHDESIRWAMEVFTHTANMIESWLEEGAGDHLPKTPDYWCSWCPEEFVCPAKALVFNI